MMNNVAKRAPEFQVKKYVDEYLKDRRERLEDLAKKIDIDHLDVEINVCIGVPYKALLKEIEEKNPDILVMVKRKIELGGHGHWIVRSKNVSPLPDTPAEYS